MSAAAADVANIGSAISAAHMAAAPSTVAVIPAAADEVSSGIAHLFSQHAQEYQALAGQAEAYQQQFVQHLTASAQSYASAEAANASLLQSLTAGTSALSAADDPMDVLLGQVIAAALIVIAVPIIGVLLLPFLALIGVGLALIFGFVAVGAGAFGLLYLAQLIAGML
jgi:PE family